MSRRPGLVVSSRAGWDRMASAIASTSWTSQVSASATCVRGPSVSASTGARGARHSGPLLRSGLACRGEAPCPPAPVMRAAAPTPSHRGQARPANLHRPPLLPRPRPPQTRAPQPLWGFGLAPESAALALVQHSIRRDRQGRSSSGSSCSRSMNESNCHPMSGATRRIRSGSSSSGMACLMTSMATAAKMGGRGRVGAMLAGQGRARV